MNLYFPLLLGRGACQAIICTNIDPIEINEIHAGSVQIDPMGLCMACLKELIVLRNWGFRFTIEFIQPQESLDPPFGGVPLNLYDAGVRKK